MAKKIPRTKLEKARDKAIVKKLKSGSILEIGYYDDKDLLKHYIRKYYWQERIKILRRDNSPILAEGIRYFTFCSKYAYDVRYFAKNKLIDFKNALPPFVFVEFLKDDFDFLNEQFINNKYKTSIGFYGSLAEIATSPVNEYYGKFWSTFPFDVINLDYLGDILKSNSSSGKIGVNDFYSILAIISKQAILRRSYEFWITLRAKPGRFDPSIKAEFRQLVKQNIIKYSTFKKKYNEIFIDEPSVDSLDDDKLFIIGYLKWLWYVCKISFSTINSKKIKIIKYKRTDKDGDSYYLYNIFLRIEPFDQIIMPSPASTAGEYCEAEYIKGIEQCFLQPFDITEDFEKLSNNERLKMKNELTELHKEYLEDGKGWIN